MKVVIAGSRNIKLSIEQVTRYVQASGFVITELICGMANGVDSSGLDWARATNIPFLEFPAEWRLFGKYAGHLRNLRMARTADAAIVVWDGKSPGTANMLEHMNNLNKPVKLFVVQ